MKLKHLLLVALLASVPACTEQDRAKNYGGTMTINLPAEQKLVNITWKDQELWYLTKPMKADDVAETYTFKEDSRWGVVQGKVVLIERKAKQ